MPDADSIRAAPPAHAFVVLCARPPSVAVLPGAIADMAERVTDWDAVLAFAQHHRVTPLVANRLRSATTPLVPAAVRKAINDQSLQNVVRSTHLSDVLITALAALEKVGIRDAVPMRGPVMSQWLYGDLTLRQFDDLDILLFRQDIPTAMQALAAAGYTQKMVFPIENLDEYLDEGWEIILKKGSEPYWLELHDAVAPRYYPVEDATRLLGGNMASVHLHGRLCTRFNNETELLVMCLHASTHCWQRLSWIMDVAALIGGSHGIQWDTALKAADRAGLRRVVRVGLALACELGGAEAPPSVRNLVQTDGTVQTLARQTAQRLLTDTAHRPLPQFARLRHYVRSRERPRDRLLTIWRMVFMPSYKDRSLSPLPSGLRWLHYLTRPFRLAWRALGRARTSDPDHPRSPAG